MNNLSDLDSLRQTVHMQSERADRERKMFEGEAEHLRKEHQVESARHQAAREEAIKFAQDLQSVGGELQNKLAELNQKDAQLAQVSETLHSVTKRAEEDSMVLRAEASEAIRRAEAKEAETAAMDAQLKDVFARSHNAEKRADTLATKLSVTEMKAAEEHEALVARFELERSQKESAIDGHIETERKLQQVSGEAAKMGHE